MNVHEYQAKDILRRFKVPVPKGSVAHTPSEARTVAEEICASAEGEKSVVIKAQVHAGGRGKGGGIKVARNPDEAEKVAESIIGMTLVTHQTGPQGKRVRRVLVEEAVEAERELYLGIVIDRAACRPVVIASEAGGMEIEEVAAQSPEKIYREEIDPSVGLQSFQARKLASCLGLGKGSIRKASGLVSSLYRVFESFDCSLAEINPLVVTREGEVLALDAKLNFDDNALYRQEEVRALRDLDEEEPSEVEASKHNLSYIRLDGTVGCMVNGAGLAMATMDIIKLAGAEPANFLDVGGGTNPERVAEAFKILTSDKNVKTVLINIFGGIVRCDRVAEGIIGALGQVAVDVPIVVRLQGTNATEAAELLQKADFEFTVATTFKDAAEKVVAVA